ncbi:MAG: hypothetical protein ABSA72_10580 [Nitrososphaerales archaeon]
MQVTFTRHAIDKFELLDKFGFKLSNEQVISVITTPDKTETNGSQTFSMKALDRELALRVVHERRKGIIVVITFYPVKRKKYGL